MRMIKYNALHSLAAGAGLLFLFSATPAVAGCEDTPDLVADDIVDLAEDTLAAGARGIWMRKGYVDIFAGKNLAKKLDADAKSAHGSRRGAATKLREGKVEAALKKMADYVTAVEKTKVVDDPPGAQAMADGLVDDALFLSVCINDL